MPQDLQYWLILNRAPHLSTSFTKKLIDYFHTAQNIVTAKEEKLIQCGLNKATIYALHNPEWSIINEEIQWANCDNHHIITLKDPHYPKLLQQITDPPLILYIKGSPEILNQPQLAIVGSRNPSPTGTEIAQEFAYALSQAGLVITSGLALGIDAASHQGALLAKGTTIAVMGCGLFSIYPKKNRELADKISQNGAIVSEFSLNLPPKRAHFPQRNRIISGLSLGTLVIEATLRSGSLITARLANEQGREVFAIPGSIYNPLSHGCHQLIQNGAKLVNSIQDILSELPSWVNTKDKWVDGPKNRKQDTPSYQPGLDEAAINLLDCFGYEPISMDELILRSHLTAAQASSLLLELELKGYINSVLGGYIRAKR